MKQEKVKQCCSAQRYKTSENKLSFKMLTYNLTLLLKIIVSKMLTKKCMYIFAHICTFPLDDKIKVPLGKK